MSLPMDGPANVVEDAVVTIYPKASEAKQGMRITMQDLTFSVPSNVNKGEKAQLLSKISGYFEPGQMTALMGPSGSGKTTLLDIMAGRKTTGSIDGTIRYGGVKPTPAFLRRYTGYVEQFDTLIPSLTVFEMLMYTAELKRPHSEPLASKRAAVEELLERLALSTCRDVNIGGQLSKGISGGQAKRVNIGIALITNPRVLFLDEPTSGLDSFTSNEVMTVVKGLVKSGVTIVATIHSPTAYAFSLFDRVMMLSRGNMVYAGPTGARMMAYIHNHMPQDLLDKHSIASMGDGEQGGLGSELGNMAEFLVDLVTDADRTDRVLELAAAYAGSPLRAENDAQLAAYTHRSSSAAGGANSSSRMMKSASAATLSSSAGSDDGESAQDAQHARELATRNGTVTPWWWAIKTLIKYRTSTNYRDPAWLLPRFADKIIIGLLVTTLYLGIGSSTSPTNLSNQANILFMWIALPSFGAGAFMPAIMMERPLFVRERNDGLYRVISYLAAKMFDELALSLFSSLGVAAMVFYGLGLLGNFGLFWITYYVTLCFGIVLAYLVAGIAPNMDAANAMLPLYVTMLLFFGGLLMNFNDMPAWWKWFSYINPVKYGWGTLMVNQFGEADPEWQGTTLLAFYGFDGINKWAYLGIEAGFFIVFFILAWAALSFRKFTSR